GAAPRPRPRPSRPPAATAAPARRCPRRGCARPPVPRPGSAPPRPTAGTPTPSAPPRPAVPGRRRTRPAAAGTRRPRAGAPPGPRAGSPRRYSRPRARRVHAALSRLLHRHARSPPLPHRVPTPSCRPGQLPRDDSELCPTSRPPGPAGVVSTGEFRGAVLTLLAGRPLRRPTGKAPVPPETRAGRQALGGLAGRGLGHGESTTATRPGISGPGGLGHGPLAQQVGAPRAGSG